jgi:hypothetical protein
MKNPLMKSKGLVKYGTNLPVMRLAKQRGELETQTKEVKKLHLVQWKSEQKVR